MKKMFVVILTVWSFMLLLPLSVIGKEITPSKQQVNAYVKVEEKTEGQSIADKETFRVLNTTDNTITEMSAEDYIFGVVAAEMPALYDVEALKAQAVAAYTFALRRSAENSKKDYDITTDFTKDQSFISKEKAKENWGEKYDEYAEKLNKVIKDTKGYKITYKKEPILAVYHAVSSGKTNNSKDVWNVDLAYLKPVLSEWDKLYENYISEVSFTAAELKGKFKNVEFIGEESKYFSNITYNDSSAVKTINLCATEFKGDEIREALGLRSQSFKVEYKDEKFLFTVYGYGHGVGMSQYGADCMAKNGSDFKEILTYYYTDCKIEK